MQKWNSCLKVARGSVQAVTNFQLPGEIPDAWCLGSETRSSENDAHLYTTSSLQKEKYCLKKNCQVLSIAFRDRY